MRLGKQGERVVILGANGTMGVGAAGVFAGAGYRVTMLARELEKAHQAIKAVQDVVRSEAIAELLTPGSYDRDLAASSAEAALIFESLAEDFNLKREFLARVDSARASDTVVATGSSGLSISGLAQGLSESFRRHFLGVHLFNPPHLIVGTELVPHAETDPALVKELAEVLARRLNRKVIVARDKPAFVGNRIGFKVMNEAAQLAAEHGVTTVDYLCGPHTGRAMAPLATLDLVGWDVHKAIVDNVFEKCPDDEAREAFRLPQYFEQRIAEGRLGDKTPERGGFYRRRDGRVEVLEPRTGQYRPFTHPQRVEFVERMKELNHVGRYRDALMVLLQAEGREADLVRRFVLGYVSYALNRIGDVAESASDIDTIMCYGFNWTPPSALVDLIGPGKTAELIAGYGMKVPPVIEAAARNGQRLFKGSQLDYGRTLVG